MNNNQREMVKKGSVSKCLRNAETNLLSVQNAFSKSVKAKSHCAIRLHLCKSIFTISLFIIFAPSYVNSLRQNCFKCCDLHDLIYVFS